MASVAWGVLVGHQRRGRDPALDADGAASRLGVDRTDAVISVRLRRQAAVFGSHGVITGQVIAVALLIGVVASRGAFLARALVGACRSYHTVVDAVVCSARRDDRPARMRNNVLSSGDG